MIVVGLWVILEVCGGQHRMFLIVTKLISSNFDAGFYWRITVVMTSMKEKSCLLKEAFFTSYHLTTYFYGVWGRHFATFCKTDLESLSFRDTLPTLSSLIGEYYGCCKVSFEKMPKCLKMHWFLQLKIDQDGVQWPTHHVLQVIFTKIRCHIDRITYSIRSLF